MRGLNMNKDGFATITRLTEVYVYEAKRCSFFERFKTGFPYYIDLSGMDEKGNKTGRQRYYVHRICFENAFSIIIDRLIEAHYHNFKVKPLIYWKDVTARITVYPDKKYSVALIERKEANKN